MRRKNKRKFGICAYCGKEKTVSDDHIPPKCLFSKPRPENMITAPKCDDCYPGASNDDEDFRQKLFLRLDTFEHREVKKIWPKIQRAFENPKKIGMTKAFLKTICEVEITTPAGIYLGNAQGYKVDFNRIYRVVERIIKGLFYNHTRRCLPETYYVKTFSLNEAQRDKILTNKTVSRLITIGNGIFSYCFLQPFEDQNVTFTLLLFFERVAFLSLTLIKTT